MHISRNSLFGSVLVLALLFLAPPLQANDGSNIYSSGLDTCGKWNKQRGSSNINEVAAAYVMRAWILGYISGVDAYTSSDEPYYIRNVDTSAIEQWIDGYCKDNPLDELWQAADQLLTKLATRKQANKP